MIKKLIRLVGGKSVKVGDWVTWRCDNEGVLTFTGQCTSLGFIVGVSDNTLCVMCSVLDLPEHTRGQWDERLMDTLVIKEWVVLEVQSLELVLFRPYSASPELDRLASILISKYLDTPDQLRDSAHYEVTDLEKIALILAKSSNEKSRSVK